MKARNLFQRLGYEFVKTDYGISYENENDYGVKYVIYFYNDHRYCCEIVPTFHGEVHHFVRLDKNLLKAINKQIEEMEEENNE